MSLQPRTHGGEVSSPTAGDLGGSSLEETEWTGKVPDLADLAGVIVSDGDELASLVVDEKLVRRRGEASYYRRRVGWVARRDGIEVATFEQRLDPQPDGRMRPEGGYAHVGTQTYSAKGQPRRRRGDVPDDEVSGAGGGETSSRGAGPSRHPEWTEPRFRAALASVSYLPAPVRSSFMGAVRAPELFLASLVQHGDGAQYTVTGLRLGRDAAAVVVASRQGRATTWQVEQLTYTW